MGAIVAATVAAVVPAPAAGARAEPNRWVRNGVPVPTRPTGGLNSVSCPEADFCVAVSDGVGSQGDHLAYAEVGRGSRWRLSHVPRPPRTEASYLSAVSCSSPSACVAVGHRYDIAVSHTVPFAVRWNGRGWQNMTIGSADPAADSRLSGVSCTDARHCIAVGDSGGDGARHAIAARWFAGHWQYTAVSAPGAGRTRLRSVSCPSRGFCAAVGDLDKGILVEHWNGHAWHAPASRHFRRGPKHTTRLSSVSCSAPHRCSAIGSDQVPIPKQTEYWLLVADLDGGQWHADFSAVPSRIDNPIYTYGLSCTAPAACVGIAQRPYTHRPQRIVRRTANGWHLQVMKRRDGHAVTSSLIAISCHPKSCALVGRRDRGRRTGVAHYAHGVIALVAAPARRAPTTTELDSVSCPTRGMCAAVGLIFGNGRLGYTSLIEMRHGSSWRRVGKPIFDIDLASVSCPTTRFCMAVGTPATTRGPSLAVRWDGTRWHKMQLTRDILGVSCPSPRFCMAVGGTGSMVDAPSAEIWRPGHDWRVVHVPVSGQGDDNLADVSCISSSFCLAAGDSHQHGYHSLVARWNGTSWSHVDTGDWSASFFGVSCTSRRFCMTSGNTIAKWNGRRMSLSLAPSGPREPFYDDVSCVSPHNCTIAGSRRGRAGGTSFIADRTLIAHWDGSQWRVVPSPNGSPLDHDLEGISCLPGGCTAVGVRYGHDWTPLVLANLRR